MPTSKKNPATERVGGPGLSHQNRQEPEKSKPRGGHPVDNQSSDFSGVSGAATSPTRITPHDPKLKGPTNEPAR